MSGWNNAMKLQGAHGHFIAGIDFDHVGAYLFEKKTATVDPQDLVPDPIDAMSELPPQPPAVSGYREADIAGIACWNCGHFTPVADTDADEIIDGICNLWETQADGSFTCDRFTAHSDLLRQGPHTSWQEDMQRMQEEQRMAAMGPSVDSYDYSDSAVLNEIAFSGGDAVEEDGLVWKDILRTGEWTHTPTDNGVIAKHLRIIRDGDSDPVNGVISLSELQDNFNEGVIRYVTVPLSDDERDHKNIARLNTGFVRKLKLVDRDGVSFLRAGFDFTEPEIKAKVLRGTIPDVSPGVPFGVTRRKDNKFFRTVLDHVCLTRRPFIDGLAPFGMAASDSDAQMPVEMWNEEELQQSTVQPDSENQAISLTFREQERAFNAALRNQLHLASEYSVTDINPSSNTIVVAHRISSTRWTVPFRISNNADEPVRLATVDRWNVIENQESGIASENQVVTASEQNELTRARELRELRLAQPTGNLGGISMSVTAPSLDGLELSDEQRSRVQTILNENTELRRRNRESAVNERIAQLQEIPGMKDRPGALKFYRAVMLSDDGMPAMALFSDDPKNPGEGERITAIQILDRFIKALEGDGGVAFSDQALASGNDIRPADNADGEKKPLEDRVKEAKKALYGNEDGPTRRRRSSVTGK